MKPECEHPSIWTWLKRIVGGVASGAAADVCLGCRSLRADAGAPLSLCPSCFAGIPWIREIRCAVCGRPDDCGDCSRRRETFFVQSRSSVRYDDVMKAWLARWKYRGDERMASLFAGMLMHAYRRYADAGIRFDALTYIPLSRERLLERGFNQAEQLAAVFGRMIGVPVVSLLERIVHTDKQSLKSRADRLADLQEAFAFAAAPNDIARHCSRVRDGWQSAGPMRILLLDDVYTTGSTLNQCAKVIGKAVKADIYGLTWAR